MDNGILPNCQIKLEGTKYNYEGDSGDEGYIEFQDIGEDVYKLTVEKDGYVSYVEEGIVIDSVHKNFNFHAELKPKPKENTIVASVTPVLAGVEITAYNENGTIVYKDQTGADGTVTMPNMKYGEYLIKAIKDGYSHYNINIVLNEASDIPQDVEIKLDPIKEENTVTGTTSQGSSGSSTPSG